MPRYTVQQALEYEVERAIAAIDAAKEELARATTRLEASVAAADAATGKWELAQERKARAELALKALTGPAISAEGLVAHLQEEQPTDDDGNGDEPVGQSPLAHDPPEAMTPREKQRSLRHTAAALADEPVKEVDQP